MVDVQGIILAGGTGSRLHPLTSAVNKHLLPVFDKPLIYYPLSTLMLAGVRDVIVVTGPQDMSTLAQLLGDGSQIGVHVSFVIQDHPRGIADGLALCADAAKDAPAIVALGDNIFHGAGFGRSLRNHVSAEQATIVAYEVSDPTPYAVVEFDADGKALSITEKPREPKSSWAVPGLYFLPPDFAAAAGEVPVGARGEVEITDLNLTYLKTGRLNTVRASRGAMWIDVGTPQRLFEASSYVEGISRRQGRSISCPEEIAYSNGWITRRELLRQAEKATGSVYGQYLNMVARQDSVRD